MPKNKIVNFEKEIMEKITVGKISMRPKWCFVVGSLLLGIGFAGSIVFSIIFVNLAFFRLRVQAPLGFLWFGQFGIRPFLQTFPLLPLVLSLVGFVGGLYFLKKYDISYKKSFLGLTLTGVALVLILGLLLDRLDFAEKLGQIKDLRGIYHAQFAGSDWIIGEVLAVSDRELELETPSGEKVKVVWNESTLLPFGADFKTGERIRVVGEWRADEFIAKGIGKGGMQWRRQMFDVENRKQTPTKRSGNEREQ